MVERIHVYLLVSSNAKYSQITDQLTRPEKEHLDNGINETKT